MSDPALLSATALLAAYRAKTLSPVETAKACLARLDRFEPQVNAFIEVSRDAALAAATASEARWMKGEPLGPVDGVPATVKDNIPQAGSPRRNGSKTTSDAPAAEDGSTVRALRAQGAVFLGRTTMPEFGWIGHCNSPLTGVTRNPWKPDRTTGGSSGGAAAACALSIGALHLGTDGAGSIRIPASFTGVYGFKPTYGRVPTWPGSTFTVLAHHGPLTRTVADAALAMSVLSAPDARDIFAWNAPAHDYVRDLDHGVKGLRVGFSARLGYVSSLDPEVEKAARDAAKVFEELGAHVEEADPGFADPLDLIQAMWFGGAATAALSISPEARDRLDPGFRAVVDASEDMQASRFIDACSRGRAALLGAMNAFHERYDLLLTPTMPIPAFAVARDVPAGFATRGGPLAWLDWSPYCHPFNLTQQPAASCPCGFTGDGLPIGLQIVAPKMRDDRVLQASRAFESARPFRMPA
ncbi:MAG: amidase [Rhizobiales bacterium 65-9]|nr:amidase [Hyphomicrobiales bacterium]OJY34767.1 MAG: amidase [Rhizobiales bacterium 65-9]